MRTAIAHRTSHVNYVERNITCDVVLHLGASGSTLAARFWRTTPSIGHIIDFEPIALIGGKPLGSLAARFPEAHAEGVGGRSPGARTRGDGARGPQGRHPREGVRR